MGAANGNDELVVLFSHRKGRYRARARKLSAGAQRVSRGLEFSGLRRTLYGISRHASAHHGLLVASAIAKDFDTALTHGSASAMAAARSEDRRDGATAQPCECLL